MKTEKLTLKHLAAYLPYGLKVFFKDFRKSGIIKHPNGSIFDLTIYNITYLDYDVDKKFTIFKPILKPLIDLDKACSVEFGYISLEDLIRSIESEHCPVKVWNELLIEHLDVFGLIDAGLAIDINKLEDETNG